MRLKHNIQMNLAGLVQDLSGEFRRAQKNYLQRRFIPHALAVHQNLLDTPYRRIGKPFCKG